MKKSLPHHLLPFILYFLKSHRLGVGCLIALGCIAGSYGTVNSYFTKVIIDIVADETSSSNLFTAILWPALALIINYEISNLTWRGINLVNIYVAPKLKNQIVEEMFAYVHLHSFKFFQENFAGTLGNAINKMSDHVEIIVNQSSVIVLRSAVQLLIALVSMYFISPVFSATLLVWVICFFGISIICSKKVKANAHDYASSQAIVSGKVIDSIANVSNVRLFARERFELQYLGKYLSSLAAKFRHKEWFLLKLWWFQGMSITGLMVVMLYSLARLRMQGLVTVGDFAFIMGLAIFVTENVWWLTEQLDTINNSIGQCQQSLRTIVHPHEITDKPHATELQVITGAISFEQVCFYYIKDNNLFDHLSIVISGGQKVGLVGFSGSGKTSFVNLIVRLFDITGGSIKIDGQDIAGVTQNSLRDNISFIPQDPVLFHRSLIENIRYGKGDASREEVVEAAKKAHAHQFILEIPGGYDALVGERGIKLSGGQRQRIAIARAMIKDSPIVILDEATSALDSVTEGYIQDSLDSLLMHNKTVLVIAHRLSTLLDMDRILVFDKGVIVEDGNHNELLKKNGMYSLLWNSQVGGFLPE